MTVPFIDKSNQRLIGEEELILAEPHTVGITGLNTVSPDFIRLIEVPLLKYPSSVVIQGFSEVTTLLVTNEFKIDFTNVLKSHCKKIEISKPNQFDVSGFFELNSGEIYYFSISDLRWDKNEMLIRTANDFKDYTGGSNGFISLNSEFENNLKSYLNL